MVTVHSLHLIFVGIFFLVVSQSLPFEELILSFMMIMGIILVVLGIILRIILTVGLKIKKEFKPDEKSKQNSISKNYYFSYFLISIAFVFTIVGIMTMPNTGYLIENHSTGYPSSSEIPLYEGDSSPSEIPEYENDVVITPVVPNQYSASEHDYPFGLTGPMMSQETCNDSVLSQWQPTVEGKKMTQQLLEICIQRGFVTHDLVERGKIADSFTTRSIHSSQSSAGGDIEKTIQILEKMVKNEN